MKRDSDGFMARHWRALKIAFSVFLPIILRFKRRPLVLEKWSGIGDIVCTIPAALKLKERHAGAPVIYNCHPGSICLPRLAGVTEYVTCDTAMGTACYWFRFLVGEYYQFCSDDDRPDVVPTEIYIKDFGRHVGVTVGDDHPELAIPQETRSRIETLLRDLRMGEGQPVLVIHPGPSWPIREWPVSHWCRLVEQLRAAGFTQIIHLGTSQAGRSVPTIPGTFPLVDRLSLEETAALIAYATLFVGIDSGLLHLAAAVKTPAVGLWGPTSAHLRFNEQNARSFVTATVPCQGCHHTTPRPHWIDGCPNHIACMNSITPEQVAEACLTRLKEEDERFMNHPAGEGCD